VVPCSRQRAKNEKKKGINQYYLAAGSTCRGDFLLLFALLTGFIFRTLSLALAALGGLRKWMMDEKKKSTG